jgi:uncharacterized membrane protein
MFTYYIRLNIVLEIQIFYVLFRAYQTNLVPGIIISNCLSFSSIDCVMYQLCIFVYCRLRPTDILFTYVGKPVK